MKHLHAVLALFFALIVLPLACASSYEVLFNQADNKILAEYSIILDSPGEIRAYIPANARAVSADLNYSLVNENLVAYGKEAKISYVSEELDKSGDSYYFVHDLKFYSNFDNVTTKFTLQRGYFLDNSMIFPKAYGMETDGQVISVIWTLQNVKAGDSMPMFLTIKTEKNNSLVIGLIIALVIAIVLARIVIVYVNKTKTRVKKPKQKLAGRLEDKYLVESEKAVLNTLKKADRGEIWQKQIQIATGFSKAKISRIIRSLELRNLIEKIPFGNTNKVRLR